MAKKMNTNLWNRENVKDTMLNKKGLQNIKNSALAICRKETFGR